jgi:hypothetical protein
MDNTAGTESYYKGRNLTNMEGYKDRMVSWKVTTMK